MRLNPAVKRILRQHVEEALLKYRAWKRGEWVSPALRPYLDTLEEKDIVGAYVSPLRKYHTRDEHQVLMLYLDGLRPREIALAVRDKGISQDQVDAWLWGTAEKMGFLPTMAEEFIKTQRYCPFCDSVRTRGGGAKGSSYPLSGKTCPHRELEEGEDDEY